MLVLKINSFVKKRDFLNWFLISRFDCEVLSRLSLFFSAWEWYFFYWYIQSQQSHMRVFPIHGKHLSGRVQSSLRATSDVNNHEIRQPHLSWETSIRPCLVVSGQRPTWTIMRSGNPMHELLCEFTLHCLLLRNLSIRSSPFWQQ